MCVCFRNVCLCTEMEVGPPGPLGLRAVPAVVLGLRSVRERAITRPLATGGECVWARPERRGEIQRTKETVYCLHTGAFCKVTV